ncbi:NAD(P)H-dependent oxidoreductase [Lacticaseibacillus kribbianus]|uniref:NAD(P)H-dependent oxidoreductase n=1 Tax=Lacticaseibacillus kribbianus TaxID=2926292 RepID=UPI001CD6170E|nr:NAD(P)H-dependent oxidoreductase [Lacticaseibacillus kribbianus]
MKTLIIVGHPDIDGSDTQQFLKAAAAEVPTATWRPLPATTGAATLAACDRLVLQFPLHWYQAPGLLTDWLTATLAQPAARTALAGKSLGVVATFGQSASAFHPGAGVGVSLDALLSPYQALATKLGMRLLPPLTVAQFAYADEAARRALFVRYQQYLTLADPASIAQQAAWWAKRLNQQDQPAAATLATALTARQERLAGLAATLHTVEEGTTLG